MLFLFAISTIFMLIVIFKLYKKIVTPFSMLVLPFLGIILFVNIIGRQLGYYKISEEVILFILLIFISFFIANILILFFSNKLNKSIKVVKLKEIDFAMKAAMLISLSAFGLLFIKSYFVIGLDNFFSDEMANITEDGIFAHIKMIGYPAFYYFFYKFFKTKDKLSLIFLILFLFFSFGSMTKYHVIFPVLGVFMFISFYIDNLKIIKYSIILFLIVTIIFVGNYSIYFLKTQGSLEIEKIIWSFDHMISYIVGGPIVLSKTMGSNFSINSSVSLIERISNVILPRTFSKIGIDFFPLLGYIQINKFGVQSNIATFFGGLFYFLNYFGAIIFMFVFGLITSYIYLIALKSKSFIMRILSAHIMTIIFLMFFSNYFSLLGIWERIFWILFIPILTIIKTGSLRIKFLKVE